MNKKEYIIKNVINIIEIKDETILLKCPICKEIDEIKISKVLIRLKNKGENHFEDNCELTCSSRTCSNSQAQRRKSIRIKIENTNIKRYGYKTFLETPESNVMMLKKTIEKYGSLSNRSKVGWENYYNKTGYKHNMNNPNVVEINQKHRIDTIKNMSKERKKLWVDRRKETHRKNGTLMFGDPSNNKQGKRSKQQIDLFENLNQNIELEKIVWVDDNKYYRVDGYDFNSNTVIEFYGDYWHCNPEVYKEGEIINHRKYGLINVKEIWKKDLKRIEDIKHILNCNVIIIWEKDYLNDKNNIINKINKSL